MKIIFGIFCENFKAFHNYGTFEITIVFLQNDGTLPKVKWNHHMCVFYY